MTGLVDDVDGTKTRQMQMWIRTREVFVLHRRRIRVPPPLWIPQFLAVGVRGGLEADAGSSVVDLFTQTGDVLEAEDVLQQDIFA